MSETSRPNPNLWPRPLGTWIAAKLLAPLMILLRIRRDLPPAVFQSYFVGDLFMALPAIKILAAQTPGLLVICQPNCVELVRAEGLQPLSFNNSFCTKPGLAAFFRTLREAVRLRGFIGPVLDLDADSRTALWMKIAGSRRVSSFRRPQAAWFDRLYAFPSDCVHQRDRCLFTVRAFLNELGLNADVSLPAPVIEPGPPEAPWIISCWTRLDTKNWPLARWEEFLNRMRAAGVPFRVLVPPDGDAGFRAFRARRDPAEFLEGSLGDVARAIRESAGLAGTDNFTGHMAGYYGKPVLWINGSSDPTHVLPGGPRTAFVQIEPMPCRPCIHHCVNPEYKACLNRLEAAPVWEAFEALRRG